MPIRAKSFGAAALFDDFVGQSLERTVDFLGGKQLSFFYDAHLAIHPSIEIEGSQPSIQREIDSFPARLTRVVDYCK